MSQAVQGNNTLVCTKCQKQGSYLVSVNKGSQFIVCKECGNMMKAEVKNGQLTGRILP